MVVDDVRDLVSSELEMAGYRTVTAADGPASLDQTLTPKGL
jgi:CheY-like chemotaxis protein